MKLKFPKGFYWGAATSSYQVEGGINNNDWAKAGREEKVPTAGEATDHYYRYERDFDIAQSLAHNAHRLSIEWSRIEPEEGKFDEKEIAHYRGVLQALHERGIVPFVTLWHFTLPQWLADLGGAESKDFTKYFSRYSAYVVKHLGTHCEHWSTMNEPLIFAKNGWLRGIWPPFKRKELLKFLSVLRNLARAHTEAYEHMKHVKKDCDVSVVTNNIYFHANWNPFNKLLALCMNWFWNRYFLSLIQNNLDSIGLNYYFHYEFGGSGHYTKTDFGWDVYPEGLYHVLLELKRYELPVLIMENGVADRSDTLRAQFIKDHVRWAYRALEEGVHLLGYMHWSLLDNFEWAEGYRMRFGLVEVNYKTKERAIRPSAYVYKEICETNQLEL